jgi:hypothetical protein
MFGCSSGNNNKIEVNQLPEIYPDYTNIDIPYNIAPLNFMQKDCDKVKVNLISKTGSLLVKGNNKVFFPNKGFKDILSSNKGDTVWVKVETHSNSGWKIYKPFFWYVSPEPIDSFLTYRLIEPGYEVWNKITLSQRNVTSFKQTHIADNNLVDGSCMNCHIPNKYKPGQSFFHIRGKKGMTVLAEGNKLRGINTKPDGAYSNMIYGNWHPSGNYIAFSTNIVLPATHSIHDKRAFVYDTLSDVVVLDIRKNKVITSNLISQEDYLETFPEFSSDGKKLFFCTAKRVKLPDEYQKLQYSLCSIDFTDGKLGEKVDTLYNGPAHNKTVSELKASPDGKFITFVCFSYGTFALWHNDAHLYNYNLTTQEVDTLPGLNNNKKYSNSYHSWSSNSRWIAFASKRDNGMYGKIYFSYVDKNGKAHKPFVLPQKDPEFYDFYLKSFNVPELSGTTVPFDAGDIESFYSEADIEKVNY